MKAFLISILVAAAIIFGAVFYLGSATDSYLAAHPEIAKQARESAEAEKKEVAEGKIYQASASTQTQRGAARFAARVSSRFN